MGKVRTRSSKVRAEKVTKNYKERTEANTRTINDGVVKLQHFVYEFKSKDGKVEGDQLSQPMIPKVTTETQRQDIHPSDIENTEVAFLKLTDEKGVLEKENRDTATVRNSTSKPVPTSVSVGKDAEDTTKQEKKKKGIFPVNGEKYYEVIDDYAKENRSPEKQSVVTKGSKLNAPDDIADSNRRGNSQDNLKVMLDQQKHKEKNTKTEKNEGLDKCFDEECDREVNEIISSGHSTISYNKKSVNATKAHKPTLNGRNSTDSLDDLLQLREIFPAECANCVKVKTEKKQLAENFLLLKHNILSASETVKGYKQKCQELEDQKIQSRELKNQLEASYEETATLRQQLKRATEAVEPLTKTISQLEVEQRFAHAQIAGLKEKLADSEAKVVELAGSCGVKNPSEVLEQELEGEKTVTDKLRKRNSKLEEKISKLGEKIKDIQESHKNKIKEIKATTVSRDVTRLKNKLEKSEATILQLRKQLKLGRHKKKFIETEESESALKKEIVKSPVNVESPSKEESFCLSSESDGDSDSSESSFESSSSDDEDEDHSKNAGLKLSQPTFKERRPFPFMDQFSIQPTLSPIPPSPAYQSRNRATRDGNMGCISEIGSLSPTCETMEMKVDTELTGENLPAVRSDHLGNINDTSSRVYCSDKTENNDNDVNNEDGESVRICTRDTRAANGVNIVNSNTLIFENDLALSEDEPSDDDVKDANMSEGNNVKPSNDLLPSILPASRSCDVLFGICISESESSDCESLPDKSNRLDSNGANKGVIIVDTPNEKKETCLEKSNTCSIVEINECGNLEKEYFTDENSTETSFSPHQNKAEKLDEVSSDETLDSPLVNISEEKAEFISIDTNFNCETTGNLIPSPSNAERNEKQETSDNCCIAQYLEEAEQCPSPALICPATESATVCGSLNIAKDNDSICKADRCLRFSPVPSATGYIRPTGETDIMDGINDKVVSNRITGKNTDCEDAKSPCSKVRILNNSETMKTQGKETCQPTSETNTEKEQHMSKINPDTLKDYQNTSIQSDVDHLDGGTLSNRDCAPNWSSLSANALENGDLLTPGCSLSSSQEQNNILDKSTKTKIAQIAVSTKREIKMVTESSTNAVNERPLVNVSEFGERSELNAGVNKDKNMIIGPIAVALGCKLDSLQTNIRCDIDERKECDSSVKMGGDCTTALGKVPEKESTDNNRFDAKKSSTEEARVKEDNVLMKVRKEGSVAVVKPLSTHVDHNLPLDSTTLAEQKDETLVKTYDSNISYKGIAILDFKCVTKPAPAEESLVFPITLSADIEGNSVIRVSEKPQSTEKVESFTLPPASPTHNEQENISDNISEAKGRGKSLVYSPTSSPFDAKKTSIDIEAIPQSTATDELTITAPVSSEPTPALDIVAISQSIGTVGMPILPLNLTSPLTSVAFLDSSISTVPCTQSYRRTPSVSQSVTPMHLVGTTVAISPLPTTPTCSPSVVSPIPGTPTNLIPSGVQITTVISPFPQTPVQTVCVLSPLPCSPPVRCTVSPLAATPPPKSVLSPLPTSPSRSPQGGTRSENRTCVTYGRDEILRGPLNVRLQHSPPLLETAVLRSRENQIRKPVAIASKSARILNFNDDHASGEVKNGLCPRQYCASPFTSFSTSAFSDTKRLSDKNRLMETYERDEICTSPLEEDNPSVRNEGGNKITENHRKWLSCSAKQLDCKKNSAGDSKKKDEVDVSEQKNKILTVADNNNSQWLAVSPDRKPVEKNGTKKSDAESGHRGHRGNVYEEEIAVVIATDDCKVTEHSNKNGAGNVSKNQVPAKVGILNSQDKNAGTEYKGQITMVAMSDASMITKPFLSGQNIDNTEGKYTEKVKKKNIGQDGHRTKIIVDAENSTIYSNSNMIRTQSISCQSSNKNGKDSPLLNDMRRNSDQSSSEPPKIKDGNKDAIVNRDIKKLRKDSCEIPVKDYTYSPVSEATKVLHSREGKGLQSLNRHRDKSGSNFKEGVEKLDRNSKTQKLATGTSQAKRSDCPSPLPLDVLLGEKSQSVVSWHIDKTIKPDLICTHDTSISQETMSSNTKKDTVENRHLINTRRRTAARGTRISHFTTNQQNEKNDAKKIESFSTKRTVAATSIVHATSVTTISTAVRKVSTSVKVTPAISRVVTSLPSVQSSNLHPSTKSLSDLVHNTEKRIENPDFTPTSSTEASHCGMSEMKKGVIITKETRSVGRVRPVTFKPSTIAIKDKVQDVQKSLKRDSITPQIPHSPVLQTISPKGPKTFDSKSSVIIVNEDGENRKKQDLLGKRKQRPLEHLSPKKIKEACSNPPKIENTTSVHVLPQTEISSENGPPEKNARRERTALPRRITRRRNSDDNREMMSKSSPLGSQRSALPSQSSISIENSISVQQLKVDKAQLPPHEVMACKKGEMFRAERTCPTTPLDNVVSSVTTPGNTAEKMSQSHVYSKRVETPIQETKQQSKRARTPDKIIPSCIDSRRSPSFPKVEGDSDIPLTLGKDNPLPVRPGFTRELTYIASCFQKLESQRCTTEMVAERFRMVRCISLPRTLSTGIIAALKDADEFSLLIDYSKLKTRLDGPSPHVCDNCSTTCYTDQFDCSWNFLSLPDSDLDCENASEHNSALCVPVLSLFEKKVIKVIKLTSSEMRMSDVVTSLLRLLPRSILEDRTLLGSTTASLCRIFAALCAIKRELHRIRTFLVDLLILFKQRSLLPLLFMSVLFVWPEILDDYGCVRCQELTESPLSFCMKYEILRLANDTKLHSIEVMERLLHMRNPDDLTKNALLRKLIDASFHFITDDYEETNLQSFETVKSVELLLQDEEKMAVETLILEICCTLTNAVLPVDLSAASLQLLPEATAKECVQKLIILALYCRSATRKQCKDFEKVLQIGTSLLKALNVLKEGMWTLTENQQNPSPVGKLDEKKYLSEKFAKHIQARVIDVLLEVAPKCRHYVINLFKKQVIFYKCDEFPPSLSARIRVLK